MAETSSALSTEWRQDHITQILMLQSLTYLTVHHWYKQKPEGCKQYHNNNNNNNNNTSIDYSITVSNYLKQSYELPKPFSIVKYQ